MVLCKDNSTKLLMQTKMVSVTVCWSKRRQSSPLAPFLDSLSSIASDILHDQSVKVLICKIEMMSAFLTGTL